MAFAGVLVLIGVMNRDSSRNKKNLIRALKKKALHEVPYLNPKP